MDRPRGWTFTRLAGSRVPGGRNYCRTSLLAAAVAIALATGLFTASAVAGTRRPHRALPMIWGPVELPNGQSTFPIYHQLGVHVFQIELSWAQVAQTRPSQPQNPNDPAYVWPTELNQAVAQAARYHIRVCVLVIGAPSWANGSASQYTAPTNPADFANFLVASARRYPSVRDWMIWGEPNRDVNFAPMPANSPVGPRTYALLLNAGYYALKSVSRANVVIGGDNASYGTVNPQQFLNWMRLPNGKPPPLDYFGLNPYASRFPLPHQPVCCQGGRDIDDLPAMEGQLKQTYHRTVPLWLSEFSISSDRNSFAFDFHVSRAAQARWLTAAFKLANSLSYVAGLGWFNLTDDPPSVPDGLTNGLMTWNLQPKPAFYAYEHLR
jgi:hypothetical protein